MTARTTLGKGRNRRKQRPMRDTSGVQRREHLLFTLVDPRGRWSSIEYVAAPHDDGGWELQVRRGTRVEHETRRRKIEDVLADAGRDEASNVREGWQRLTEACTRCADGWVCEEHPDLPMNHLNGRNACRGAGAPCSNPRCDKRPIGVTPALPAR